MFSFRKYFLLAILIFPLSSNCFSQTTIPESKDKFNIISNYAKEKYGVDPLLVNGIYFENPYYNAKGHQFLHNGDFHQGSIIFRNKKYDDVRLMYDIYSQQIVINHKTSNEIQISLKRNELNSEARLREQIADKKKHEKDMMTNYLANEFISEFWLSGSHYKKLYLEDNEPKYYQVISDEGQLKCYYAWYKIRYKSYDKGDYLNYSFSDSKFKSYLVIDAELNRFWNNRSFLKLFPDNTKSQIRSFLRTNKIKVNKANDSTIKEVIHFCLETLP